MKINFKQAFLILFPLMFFSCSNNEYKVNINNINLNDYDVNRYEIDLLKIPHDNFLNGLLDLSDKYEVFLGDIKQDTNGVGLIYDFVTDDYVSKVYDECMIFYENFSQQENDFEKCFKHIKYYYPNFIAPDIYTYISGFDFEYPCVYDGENLFLALDMYLGENSNYYALGIPAYIVKKFNEDFIVRDAIEQIAAYNNASSNSYTRLIDLMIYYGKNWEFIKSMSPDMHDTIITGFTANQLNWCKKNEKDVWKYLLSDNTLFTNDLRVMKKLIDDAPYTSFFSQESPGSVCKWIGWHIVHSYMKNNKISLEEMMAIADNDLILSKSGYRP